MDIHIKKNVSESQLWIKMQTWKAFLFVINNDNTSTLSVLSEWRMGHIQKAFYQKLEHWL